MPVAVEENDLAAHVVAKNALPLMDELRVGDID
jgi:hypothetical protein